MNGVPPGTHPVKFPLWTAQEVQRSEGTYEVLRNVLGFRTLPNVGRRCRQVHGSLARIAVGFSHFYGQVSRAAQNVPSFIPALSKGKRKTKKFSNPCRRVRLWGSNRFNLTYPRATPLTSRGQRIETLATRNTCETSIPH